MRLRKLEVIVSVIVLIACLLILFPLTTLANTYRYIPLPDYYSPVEKQIYDSKFNSTSALPLEIYDDILKICGYSGRWDFRGTEHNISYDILKFDKDYTTVYTVGSRKVNNKLGDLVRVVSGSPYSYELVKMFSSVPDYGHWDEMFGIKRLEWKKWAAHSELNKSGNLTDIDFLNYDSRTTSGHMSDAWQADVITLAPRMVNETGYSLAGLRLPSTNILWGYYQYDGAVKYKTSVDPVRIRVIDTLTDEVVRDENVYVLSFNHRDWFPQYWYLDTGYILEPYDHYRAEVSFNHKINFVNSTSSGFYSGYGVSVRGE